MDNAPTTELGVLHHADEDDEPPRPAMAGPSSAAAARFTLSEEEEASPHPGGRASGSGAAPGRQPTLNVSAAQQGVVVEPLPTPVTPAPIAGGAPQV